MTKPNTRILTGDDRIHQWQSDLGSKTWPRFMQQDKLVSAHWSDLYTKFPEFQFAMLEDDLLLGIGNSLPLHWTKAPGELPDRGLDWAMEKARDDFNRSLDPSILVGVQILINPEYQGQGLAYRMLNTMKDLALINGLKSVALPVRPTLKSKYPLIPMEEYIHWKNENKLPFDPWIRVHVKAGGKIIQPCSRSMDISGTIAEWEEWTNTRVYTSGDYIIDQALVPVKMDREKNTGHYLEPNVWIVHESRYPIPIP